MSGVFQSVRSASPGRSVFNLSYEKKFTCDMGQLIPVMCDEMVPGDKFNIGNQMIIRFQPLVAPILHEINVFVHYFFVPYRLLWSDWEKFITGGEDGTFTATLPRWTPTSIPLDPFGIIWECLLESLPQTVFLLIFLSVPIILFGIVSIGMRLFKQLLTLTPLTLFFVVHGKRTILLPHCHGSSEALLLLFNIWYNLCAMVGERCRYRYARFW